MNPSQWRPGAIIYLLDQRENTYLSRTYASVSWFKTVERFSAGCNYEESKEGRNLREVAATERDRARDREEGENWPRSLATLATKHVQ